MASEMKAKTFAVSTEQDLEHLEEFLNTINLEGQLQATSLGDGKVLIIYEEDID